jgi:hypothetical protein
MNLTKLIETFYAIDEFLKEFMPYMEKHCIPGSTSKKPTRTCSLNLSEIMTILITFHTTGFRNFKTYYLYLQQYHAKEFPNLVSYNRFIELITRAFCPLFIFTQSLPKTQTGCYFIDSTALKVCHEKRAHAHKLFKDLATKSKTTTGWFFGFKLHLVVNDLGEIMSFKLTTGKVDDRVPVMDLCRNLSGKVFGDRGYLKKELFEDLMNKGIELITKIKKNMKNAFMPLWNKLMLRKRSIIETVIGQLKIINQIEHSRHRSVNNFLVNLIAGIGAYGLKDKKPSITKINMSGLQ